MRYTWLFIALSLYPAWADETLPAIKDIGALGATMEKGTQATKNDFNQMLKGITDFIKNLDASHRADIYKQSTDSINQIGGSDGCIEDGVDALKAHPTPISRKNVNTKSMAQQSQGKIERYEKIKTETNPLFTPKASDDEVASSIEMLITPVEPLDIKEEIKESSEGKPYKAITTEIEARNSLAWAAMEDVASWHRPLEITQKQIDDLSSLLGASIKPSTKGTKDDPWSIHLLFDYIVTTVYTDPNWHTWLNTTSDVGLQRAKALMLALMLKQEERRQSLLEKMASLQAVHLADGDQEIVQKANEARAIAKGDSVRQ